MPCINSCGGLQLQDHLHVLTVVGVYSYRITYMYQQLWGSISLGSPTCINSCGGLQLQDHLHVSMIVGVYIFRIIYMYQQLWGSISLRQSLRNVSDMTNKIWADLLRTDTRLVFCNRKLMRTYIFFTKTTKPICNFVNPVMITYMYMYQQMSIYNCLHIHIYFPIHGLLIIFVL